MKSQSFSLIADEIASSVLTPLLAACAEGDFPLEIEGVEGSLHSVIIAAFAKRRPLLVVAPSERDASDVTEDLRSLGVNADLFPWWGTTPYRCPAPDSLVWSGRTRVLSTLAGGISPEPPFPVVVTGQRAFMSPLPPPEYSAKQRILIKTGERLDTMSLAGQLGAWAYTRVHRARAGGEYAVRGEVFDIVMDGGEQEDAYRITLDFDRVESLKLFNAAEQTSMERLDSIVLRPLKELVWDDERIDCLSANIERLPEFSGYENSGKKADMSGLIESLISRRQTADEGLFFPLAFEKNASLLDYFDADAAVVFLEWERLANAQESIDREYAGLFRSAFRERPVPLPERLIYNFDDLTKNIKNKVSFITMKKAAASDGGAARRFSVRCEPPRTFAGNVNYMKEEFSSLSEQGWRIVIAAGTGAQVLRTGELLKDVNALVVPESLVLTESSVGGGRVALPKPESGEQGGIFVIQSQLSGGFALPDMKLMLAQEKEMFGFRRPPRSLRSVRTAAIDTFIDLNPGNFVVHINYGIGLFKGIERINALGSERDYIQLEFADAETIFVPVEQVNLVQRYIGNEGAPPRLDKIGSKNWSERKARAKRAAEELASRLIGLYSKRKAAQGFAFPPDSEWQIMFEAGFAFEETEDQARCVEEIKTDMENVIPMDRLVCGDVGYGKTEVAVRACFKAVMSGKQVAFLAPTTILAEQHYENFLERFSGFPVRVAMLSRFAGKKASREITEAVQSGGVDILVGTHRIIQKDIKFKDLGLMVIDEEQRFGVKDKERLKELRHNVDCLALSATPIPRTLHMSLLKIRDMSILATPPRNRHPIETFIDEYDEDKIVKAVRFEVGRGGQIFYLHNRIGSLDDVKARLSRLMPEILIECAHGQIGAEELEDVMRRFIHGGFHVLVSTTIIENGIDIPNVNTIIIDRADMYGVSQLYQLRGRVGRSERVAYAYLFYPPQTALSEKAVKRLQVISDFTGLGSGFKIAMKDMEIRGAGNLLGREQSGNIFSVGFDLYARLLDDAVRKLQNENYEAETDTLLELEYTGFIPNAYIDSAQEKMEVYKKIAAVKRRDELERVGVEIYDRFGPPPFELLSLLSLAEIRIICREIKVLSLKEHNGVVRAEFAKSSNVNVERLLRLIKESGGRVKLDPAAPNVILLQTGKIGLKEKSEFIREKLEALA
ncbi:MAG: transcription-repair coupling factor [Spirochaetaceae bacterium]|nr:transcription-repair coupling factor [Spirochaetaceae bacterium]